MSIEDFDLRKQLLDKTTNQSEQFKILMELLSTKDIKTKTEINKPHSFAVLSVFSKFLEDLGFSDSSNIINFYMEEYMLLNLSKKRASRKEIIEGLKALGFQADSLQINPNMTQPIRR